MVGIFLCGVWFGVFLLVLPQSNNVDLELESSLWNSSIYVKGAGRSCNILSSWRYYNLYLSNDNICKSNENLEDPQRNLRVWAREENDSVCLYLSLSKQLRSVNKYYGNFISLSSACDMKPWPVHIFTTFPLPYFFCCDVLISYIAQKVSHSVLRNRLISDIRESWESKQCQFWLMYQRKEEDHLSCWEMYAVSC